MVSGSAQGSDTCWEPQRKRKEAKDSGKARLGSAQHLKGGDRRKEKVSLLDSGLRKIGDPTEPHGGS